MLHTPVSVRLPRCRSRAALVWTKYFRAFVRITYDLVAASAILTFGWVVSEVLKLCARGCEGARAMSLGGLSPGNGSKHACMMRTLPSRTYSKGDSCHVKDGAPDSKRG